MPERPKPYRPPSKTELHERLASLVASLPEQEANKSRDYGLGYAQAIRDVLGLIAPPDDAGGTA